MSRLDQALVEKGLAASRTRAKDLIEAGQVTVHRRGSPLKPIKASFEVEDGDELEVQAGEIDRYVSRGGLKLRGALEKAGLEVKGMNVLDVGQSTGGFTDCLLQNGAAFVVGIDVGHGQIHERIRGDARVAVLEGLHAKDLPRSVEFAELWKDRAMDLVVVDVSFISLASVLPPLSEVAPAGCRLLALVKPQFEVGPQGLGKGGVVRDPLLYGEVESKIRTSAESAGWKILSYFESSLDGKDGNREFFCHAVKN